MNPREEAVTVIARDEDPEGGRLTIATSDGATYEVAPSAPEARSLAPGVVLSAEQVEGLRFAVGRKAVARAAFRQLDRRPWSVARLRRRLLDADHPVAAVEAVLERLVDQGLLDDRQYAESYARDQLRRKPVGRRWLLSKLREQGVGEGDALGGVDAVLPVEREPELCRRALQGRRVDLAEENGRARALRFLLSRGFSRGMAASVVFAARDAQEGEERG